MVKNSLGEYDDCSIEFCAINYLGKKYCSIFTVQSTFVRRSGHRNASPKIYMFHVDIDYIGFCFQIMRIKKWQTIQSSVN